MLNLIIQTELTCQSYQELMRALNMSIEMPIGGQQSGKFGFQIGHPWITPAHPVRS
jgi:hypothetical protein